MTKSDVCITEDPLITNLLSAKGKHIEVFAFGITYIGELKSVDPENGFITISDGTDTVMLELERVESFNIAEEPR